LLAEFLSEIRRKEKVCDLTIFIHGKFRENLLKRFRFCFVGLIENIFFCVEVKMSEKK
jgi:hypothetical protein